MLHRDSVVVLVLKYVYHHGNFQLNLFRTTLTLVGTPSTVEPFQVESKLGKNSLALAATGCQA